MKAVCIVVITYFNSANFFIRLARSDQNRHYRFITTSPVVYLKLKSLGHHAIFVWPRLTKKMKSKNIDFLGKTLEESMQYESRSKLISIFNSLTSAVESCINQLENYESRYLMTWNGDNVAGSVLRAIKYKDSTICTGFFEISNLPGKIFVDGRGVNKNSSIFKDISVLKKFPYNEREFESFKSGYLDLKNNYTPDRTNYFNLMPRVFEYVFVAIAGPRYFNLYKPIRDFINEFVRPSSEIDVPQEVPPSFVLYPMQVRTDSQIVLNSSIGVFEALEFILKTTSGYVVVTPHPFDKGITDELRLKFKKDLDRIIISNESTLSLLPNAEKVFVINSTVGLESLILGKQTEFLGHSFYGLLDEKNLGAYICGFLIDVEFYSYDNMQESSISKIFKTIDITNSN